MRLDNISSFALLLSFSISSLAESAAVGAGNSETNDTIVVLEPRKGGGGGRGGSGSGSGSGKKGGNGNSNPKGTGSGGKGTGKGTAPANTGRNTGRNTANTGADGKTQRPNTQTQPLVLTGKAVGQGGVTQYVPRVNGHGGGFYFNPYVAGLGGGLVGYNLHHYYHNGDSSSVPYTTATINSTESDGKVNPISTSTGYTQAKKGDYYSYSDASTTFTMPAKAIITLAPSLVKQDYTLITSRLSELQKENKKDNDKLASFMQDFFSSVQTETWLDIMSKVHTSTQTVNIDQFLSYYKKDLPKSSGQTSEYSVFLSTKVKDFLSEASELTAELDTNESSSSSSSSSSAGGARDSSSSSSEAVAASLSAKAYGVTFLVSTALLAIL